MISGALALSWDLSDPHAEVATLSVEPGFRGQGIGKLLSTIAEAARLIRPVAGFYAWWMEPGALPGFPEHPTPPRHRFELLYVGISPSRPTSSSNLAARVLKQHVGGNTGSSTFRLSLASLLFESEGWEPIKTTKKVVLTKEDNTKLRRWQEEHLRISWTTCRGRPAARPPH